MPASKLGFQPSTRVLLPPQCRRRRHGTCPARPAAKLSPDDVVLEGDLIAYRPRTSSAWTVAAVVSPPQSDNYLVRPVVQRQVASEKEKLEVFVDWAPETAETVVTADICDIRLLEADFEERIVQNRIENPHGEISEYCWRVSRDVLSADFKPILLSE